MDAYRSPSVFELIACEQLKSGLREALRYLLENIYQLESVRRLPIPRTDEAILILDLFIEFNHLRTYHASYAEHLYNLVRISTSTKTESKHLLPSLVCLTIVPYMKRKLDKYFEELNYKDIRTADELRRIRVYRLFSRSCSILNLVFLVRFGAGRSEHHNYIESLLGISLMGRLSNPNDNDGRATSLVDKVSKMFADLSGRGLTMGSYAIQFLDYWNTRNNSAPLFNASLPIPEPPKKDDDLAAYTDERSSNICLICLHLFTEIRNDEAKMPGHWKPDDGRKYRQAIHNISSFLDSCTRGQT